MRKVHSAEMGGNSYPRFNRAIAATAGAGILFLSGCDSTTGNTFNNPSETPPERGSTTQVEFENLQPAIIPTEDCQIGSDCYQERVEDYLEACPTADIPGCGNNDALGQRPVFRSADTELIISPVA